jgi:ATP-dependent DNA ligase
VVLIEYGTMKIEYVLVVVLKTLRLGVKLMFKQQKAKTYGKDKIKDLEGLWRLSKKYDGHQIFIQKIGNEVKFFTSNHKPFDIKLIREHLSQDEYDYILIGEYLYDCDGKLGSRSKSTKVTTFRTNFAKGLENPKELEENSKIMIFDCIPIFGDGVAFDTPYYQRIIFMQEKVDLNISQLQHEEGTLCKLQDGLENVDKWVSNGWEGGMLIRPDEHYYPGKRVHHAVKLKGRHTADLLCIDTTEGDGKYQGMIGSLTLRDKAGRVLNVGSGLCDVARSCTPDNYIGKVIEIQYERIDETYIQSVYIGAREDKNEEEID